MLTLIGLFYYFWTSKKTDPKKNKNQMAEIAYSLITKLKNLAIKF